MRDLMYAGCVMSSQTKLLFFYTGCQLSNINKILRLLTFPKCGLPFCVVNITGDIEYLVQISIKSKKIVEIKTKFIISQVILNAQDRQTHFLKIPTRGVFCDY